MSGSRQAHRASCCARVREWLPEYDYGGPGRWQRWLISRHLPQCPECTRELEALRQTAALVEALPAEEAPAGMWERLEREMERAEQAATAPRIRRRVPVLTAAAAALGLALGLGFWQARQAHAPETETANSYVYSHLVLARSHPFAPRSSLDTLAVLSAREGIR